MFEQTATAFWSQNEQVGEKCQKTVTEKSHKMRNYT